MFEDYIKTLNNQKVYKAEYLKDMKDAEFKPKEIPGINTAQLKQDIAIQQ